MLGRKVLMRSDCDDWSTPQWLFDELNEEFKFDLDACATSKTAKCKQYYNKRTNGLVVDWSQFKSVFCNPPYSDISNWVDKCSDSSKMGPVVVLLIPGRVDTLYFHKYIFPVAKEVRFINGRLRFNGAKHNSTFPSVVVVFDRKFKGKCRLRTMSARNKNTTKQSK